MGLRRLVGWIHPRSAVVLHDLAMVWVAWIGANWLRWSLAENPRPVDPFDAELAVVFAAQGLVLWWTGLYRGLWRFASLPDLVNIAKAGLVGVVAISAGLFAFDRLDGTPRSVLLIYPVALVLLLGLPRLAYRHWKDSRHDLERAQPQQRVLILGAGAAAEALVRDLRRESLLQPVGFVDDNRSLRGAKVQGVPVLGRLDEVGDVSREVAAEMLLIAMPSADGPAMRRVVELCEATGLPFRTIPRLSDVVEGRFGFNQLKEVAIEDLLGRDPVALEWNKIRNGLAGRRVLVTGGGGSIGSELCRQIARLGIASLVVIEQSEFNLYRVDQELRREFPDLLFVPVLGDCGDPSVLDHVFGRQRPEIVFHAAAYKHLPLLETQIREAVDNNVLATEAVALAADRHGVETMVLISTDKAVNPSSVLGASKRLGEVICQALSVRSRTHFITVRFGNVLDSVGSVVPLFREQIRQGGPVTVTHPEVARYFMTIPEACQLIMQAGVLGQGGEIFVLDMGEPVKIRYLAEQMIRLAGKIPDVDIDIQYTGLRPGEKLFEELFHDEEHYASTAHPKIFLATARVVPWPELEQGLKALARAVREFDEAALAAGLRSLVPEFGAVADPANVIPLQRTR
jgi:FlaA1/EpsC-like NDP-sugar epimerase